MILRLFPFEIEFDFYAARRRIALDLLSKPQPSCFILNVFFIFNQCLAMVRICRVMLCHVGMHMCDRIRVTGVFITSGTDYFFVLGGDIQPVLSTCCATAR